MAAKTKKHPDVEPAHPGELLEEIAIPGTGKSKTEIAKLLGVSRQTLYDLLACKQGVTPEMAVRLGKLFGDGPAVWLRMQVAHDLFESWVGSQTRFPRKPKPLFVTNLGISLQGGKRQILVAKVIGDYGDDRQLRRP